MVGFGLPTLYANLNHMNLFRQPHWLAHLAVRVVVAVVAHTPVLAGEGVIIYDQGVFSLCLV